MTEAEIKTWNEKNKHISDFEIRGDIDVTQKEIEALEYDLKAAQIRNDRWGIMKAEVGIRDRKEFIEKLQAILNFRTANL